MSIERTATMFDKQARACAHLGSPLYAALLHRAANDILRGGPCADAVAGYETAAGPAAIALRLMGGVHALVLDGRAEELARNYPSVGGSVDPDRPDACWDTFRETVAANLLWIRDWMTRPPQTNEVGRAGPLLCGLLWASRVRPMPIRLFEIGASAGLNLRADRFSYRGEDLRWGPADSPVVLEPAWQGEPPSWLRDTATRCPALDVVDRRGCDLAPIDPGTPAGALALKAYIWADQTARVARLNGALRLAGSVAARVDAMNATDFLAGVELVDGTLTVVWHSIMRQYVPSDEWALVAAEVERLAAASTTSAGFAYLAFEPRKVDGTYGCYLTARVGHDPEVFVAQAPAHGLPTYDFIGG